MYLKPSEISYSQDSINIFFDKRCLYSHKRIGETLDDICEGRSSINDVPTISVVRQNDRWITADNRRLWVFRHLERLGKCTGINVRQIHFIKDEKMTALGDGNYVRVRGNPGGSWYNRSSNYNKPIGLPSYKPSPQPYRSPSASTRISFDDSWSSNRRESSYTVPERPRSTNYTYSHQQNNTNDSWLSSCTIL